MKYYLFRLRLFLDDLFIKRSKKGMYEGFQVKTVCVLVICLYMILVPLFFSDQACRLEIVKSVIGASVSCITPLLVLLITNSKNNK